MTKNTVSNWKLGLSYFGYLLIGIIPLTAVMNLLLIYGNVTYKLIIIFFYLLILLFWMKRLVITATTLLKRKYNIQNWKGLFTYTVVYFLAVWLILVRPDFKNVEVVTPLFLEAYLIGWLLWYSSKFMRN